AVAVMLLMLPLAQISHAQVTVNPPYDAYYTPLNLGSIPGLPTPYGGVNFALGNFNKLIIGGNADNELGAIYSIDVVRDTDGHITGFSGSASIYASAPYIDGGLTYGPGNVLFASTWPKNRLLQFKPGSVAPDKVIDLTAFGVPQTPSQSN